MTERLKSIILISQIKDKKIFNFCYYHKMEDLSEYLAENVKIEIEKKFSDKKPKRYKCAFYKEIDNLLLFFIPKEDSKQVEFDIGENIRIFIYTIYGVFIFKAPIVEIGVKLLKVQKPKDMKKYQRRGLTRSKIETDVVFEFEQNSTIMENKAKTNNISGSGMSFDTDIDLTSIKNLKVRFELENKTINANAKIVEIRKYTKEKQNKYRVGIRFISLSNNEAEYIIKQCIKYQLKARKKI